MSDQTPDVFARAWIGDDTDGTHRCRLGLGRLEQGQGGFADLGRVRQIVVFQRRLNGTGVCGALTVLIGAVEEIKALSATRPQYPERRCSAGGTRQPRPGGRLFDRVEHRLFVKR